MKLNKKTFYDKVLGCFIGKNIGGTLGTPDEWKRQINNYTFYTHDITGEPLPNDDLDLQLINLKALEVTGPKLTARELADYWLMYQDFNCGEYGIAKANLKAGIQPPLSGSLNNSKKHSCGAFIRSELWACVCPGRPDLAVRYAYEDAIIDHGDGEGTYAEFMTAAMQAAAFAEKDIRNLINIGLTYIPQDCGVAKAVQTAINSYENGLSWQECRDEILRYHRGSVPDHLEFLCSKEDKEKGFHTGKLGYDAPSNIAIIVAGLLYGEGDFEKSLLITANMGEDTDCTAGFVGALFGIIMGYEALPQKWVEPIGHSIKTFCCNEAHGNDYLPKTVYELTDRVVNMAKMMSAYYGSVVSDFKLSTMDISGEETDLSSVKYEDLLCQNTALYNERDVMLSLKGPRYDHNLFSVAVDCEDYVLEPDKEVKVTLKFLSHSWVLPINLNVKWESEDFIVSPSRKEQVNLWVGTGQKNLEFKLKSLGAGFDYRGRVEITAPGYSFVMSIPIVFASYRRMTEDEHYDLFGKL